MLGMSGMPFFAGFIGKVFAFVVAGEADYLWLGRWLERSPRLSAFAFYLRVVSTIFSSEDGEVASDDGATEIEPSMSARFAVVISAVVTVDVRYCAMAATRCGS